MPFAFFHFGLEAKRMIRALVPIIRHGVLQRLIIWEIMSKGNRNGDIVDRGVHFQKSKMVNYFQILVPHQIASKVL